MVSHEERGLIITFWLLIAPVENRYFEEQNKRQQTIWRNRQTEGWYTYNMYYRNANTNCKQHQLQKSKNSMNIKIEKPFPNNLIINDD